jgi:hypothetical protein
LTFLTGDSRQEQVARKAQLRVTLSVTSVVVSELGNKQGVICDLVHDPVFFVNSTGPVATEAMFERLRFTETFKGFSLGFVDKLIDSVEDLFVALLPI